MKTLSVKSDGKQLKLIDSDGNEFDLRGGSLSLDIDEYDECTINLRVPLGKGVVKVAYDASQKQ